MSEQIKQGYCYACGRKDANIIYSGSGKNPTCMDCNTDLDKHMAEWMMTDEELNRMCDEAESAEAERVERKFTTWKEKQTKKFEIFKDGLRPIF